MAPPDDFFAGRTQPPPAPGRRDVLFVIVLLGLLALAAILWLADPAHQTSGKSRVDWPGTSSPRP